MEKLQLYGLATPNGQKVSIMLEELGLEYDAHTINIMKGDQHTPEYLKLSPNGKIPAIIDPDGPDGKPLSMMESGAILLYLANKYGKLIPKDERAKNECTQWLFFQVGHIGPMFGQFGHFYKYAKDKCEHPYPLERYTNETKRLLNVLNTRLEGRSYLVNEEYTIADITIFPWVNCLSEFYEADGYLELSSFKNVNNWLKSCNDRPASIIGRKVCSDF